MTLYDDMQNLAAELLTEFNQGTIQLVKIVPGGGPAHNPGPSTRTVTTLKGAVARGVSYKYVQMSLAVASDLQVTIAAKEATPAVGDKMVVENRELEITQVIRKPASGTPVVYTCIVKRGA